MAHLRSRRRLALAVPVVLSLTASLGFLPVAAQAAPRAESVTRAADADTIATLKVKKRGKITISWHASTVGDLSLISLTGTSGPTHCRA